jgi:hypothetical protein
VDNSADAVNINDRTMRTSSRWRAQMPERSMPI